MNAYHITWPDSGRSVIADLGYDYGLPYVICLTCEPEFKSWGTMFEYPAFQFDFLKEPEFYGSQPVSLDRFEEIKARIISAAGRPVTVMPGGGIGKLTGTSSTTKLEDFVWGRTFVPQISKRARDLLAMEGVDLLTAEFDMRCRGKTIDTHLAIQVEPVLLLTEENLRYFSFKVCPQCGHYKRYSIGNKPYMTQGLEIKLSAWPKGNDLTRSLEGGHVIASERFIAAVRRHSLTGITFVECGKYV